MADKPDWNLRSLLVGLVSGAVMSGVGSYTLFAVTNAVQDQRIDSLTTAVVRLTALTDKNAIAIAKISKR